MRTKAWETLFEVAMDQYGYVTTADAVAMDVDPTQLRLMAYRGRIDHVDRGIYRFPLVPHAGLDQYMEMVLRTQRKGVLSHATALDLHDLCDVNPAKIDVTVPGGWRTRRTMPKVLRLHRQHLDAKDRTMIEGIPVVTAFVAIRGGIEVSLGDHLISQAVATGQARGAISARQAKELQALAAVGSAR